LLEDLSRRGAIELRNPVTVPREIGSLSRMNDNRTNIKVSQQCRDLVFGDWPRPRYSCHSESGWARSSCTTCSDVISVRFLVNIARRAASRHPAGRKRLDLLYGRFLPSLNSMPLSLARCSQPRVALGEWPTAIDWIAIILISAGVYVVSRGPPPGRASIISHRRLTKSLRR
jgi:hypothetical protein